MKKKLFFIFIFCAYIAAIMTLCLIRPDGMPEKDFSFFGLPADKIVHFMMFLPFTVLAFLMTNGSKRKKKHDIAIAAAITAAGIGLAFLTEYFQSLTDYRSSDIKDIYADIAGLITGSLAIFINITLRNK